MNETQMYKIIDGLGLAPAFLGHITENGRIMGFLLEKVEGRSAGIEDLTACQECLKRVY
ncbi:hypothetical protein K440DRAFT_623853 [Wilcoxina mikolae CBS 423.85]|nr:hypothetical protein K440DRAFT_623853 [Wilcoxina mikolae CBS 423.85]